MSFCIEARRARSRSVPGSSRSPKSGASMIQATGRMRTTAAVTAASDSLRWCSITPGQKSCTMMRSPFSAWNSTEKKISSSAKRKSGLR